jgi:hypothetical protein
MFKKPRTWTNSLDKRSKRKKMDMRFGTWNVRSMYRVGSLKTVVEEISKCKLHLVGVQEVRWNKGGTEPAGEYTVTDFSILQIDGASIPRQRLGKRLLTLLCKSWLRISTVVFPKQRMCCCDNHEYEESTSYRASREVQATTRSQLSASLQGEKTSKVTRQP